MPHSVPFVIIQSLLIYICWSSTRYNIGNRMYWLDTGKTDTLQSGLIVAIENDYVIIRMDNGQQVWKFFTSDGDKLYKAPSREDSFTPKYLAEIIATGEAGWLIGFFKDDKSKQEYVAVKMGGPNGYRLNINVYEVEEVKLLGDETIIRKELQDEEIPFKEGYLLEHVDIIEKGDEVMLADETYLEDRMGECIKVFVYPNSPADVVVKFHDEDDNPEYNIFPIEVLTKIRSDPE